MTMPPEVVPSPLVPSSPDPILRSALIVGVSVPAVFVTALVLQGFIVQLSGVLVPLVGIAFVYDIAATAAFCALLSIALVRRPRPRSVAVVAGVMGLLAGLAPIGLVLFLRLSYRACAVANVLALPWAEPWRELAHWGGGIAWLASTVALIIGLVRRDLRRAAVALWIVSAVLAVPAFILFFLIVYGDPSADCVPV